MHTAALASACHCSRLLQPTHLPLLICACIPSLPPGPLPACRYSFGLLLVQLTTQEIVAKRGEWRLPRVPEECSQVGLQGLWCGGAVVGRRATGAACRARQPSLQPAASWDPELACLASPPSVLCPHHCRLVQAVLELIEQCVASEPRQRPTAAQALARLQAERAAKPLPV